MLIEIPRYVNQKNEIKKGTTYCGAACVAMIMDEDPQWVADQLGHSTSDDKLIRYLEHMGWDCKIIIDGGTAKTKWSFVMDDEDIKTMIDTLNDDKIVLFHFRGHYTICNGYLPGIFIFSDPAGDRNVGYFGKGNEGEGVKYTSNLLKNNKIKRCWSLVNEY